jgi:GNAT superfamily N-acetyltransferase
MINIKYHIVQPDELKTFKLIAGWYLSEWKIPVETTVQRLVAITRSGSQFQVLMMLDDIPIATGGLYNHVGLHEKEPRFKTHKNWLALVYTVPDQRHRGYGALICDFVQNHAKNTGVDTMYLYTDTAEPLYARLGWTEMERLQISARNIIIMKKNLVPE